MSEKERVFYPPVGTGNIELKLSREESGGAISVFVQTLPAGEGTNTHLHTNCEETGYVLEGRIRVHQGDEVAELGVGESCFVPRGVPHAVVNAGDTEARFLFVTTPGGLEEYFREISDRDTNNPGPTGQQRNIALKHGLEVVGPAPGV